MLPHCPSLLDYYPFPLTCPVSADWQDAARRKPRALQIARFFIQPFSRRGFAAYRI
jgi:hypothetical protein